LPARLAFDKIKTSYIQGTKMLQIDFSPKKKKIVFVSLILISIIFLSYISIRSFLADIHYQEAKKLSKNIETWREAASEYKKAIFILPGNAEYHDEVGQLYLKLFLLYQKKEHFEKAVFHFKKSCKLNPYNAWAHYHLAWAYWNKKMYKEAEKEAKKALELDPNNATYHWQLAVIYKDAGKLYKAASEYKEVLRIIPHHAKAKRAIKEIERKLGNTR